MDFAIPDQFEALFKEPIDAQEPDSIVHQVKNMLPESPNASLEVVFQAFVSSENGVLQLQVYFDILCVLVWKSVSLSKDLQQRLEDVLLVGLDHFIQLPETTDLTVLRSTVKMLLLLLTELLNRVPPHNGKKLKSVLTSLVAYDLQQLWKANNIESRFLALMLNATIPMLAQGISPREVVAWLLTHGKTEMWIPWTARVTQLLFSYNSKEQVSFLPTLLNLIRDKPELATSLLSSVINTLEDLEESKDNDCMRNVGTFIEELSGKLPQVFLAGLPKLITLLDCESYILRNGVVTSVKSYLKYLVKNEGEGEIEVQTALEKRNRLFNLLEARTRDKSAYSRSKALDALKDLVLDDCAPIDRCMSGLRIAKERLLDIAALVRKSAGRLLSMLIFKDKFEQGLEFQRSEEVRSLLVTVKQDIDAVETQLKGEKMTDDPIRTEEELLGIKYKLEVSATYLNLYDEFLSELTDCTGELFSLLESRQISDVLTAVEVLFLLQAKKLQAAESATRKIIPLIWSRDESVRHAVTYGFHGIYTNLELVSLEDSVEKLLNLYADLTPGEHSSLEDLLKDLWRLNLLTPDHVHYLKKRHVEKPSTALAFYLRCSCQFHPDFFLDFYEKFLALALAAAPQWDILRETLVAVACIGPCGEKSEAALLQSALRLWDSGVQFHSSWFGCMAQLIRSAEVLSNNAFDLLRLSAIELTKPLFLLEWKEQHLAKCLFVIGESALKVLVAADRTKAIYQGKKQPDLSSEQQNELEEISGLRASELQRGLEQLTAIQENCVIYKNLLSHYTPLLLRLMNNLDAVRHTLTQQAVLLAFAKFLCVSQSFCKQHLPLLFRVIDRKDLHFSLRGNAVVALGDLVQRFPCLLEQYSDKLFACLRDEDTGVKRKAILVLTHLVLNDMLKIRGLLADVLMCLLDQEVRNLIVLFLEELNKKDNSTLFNLIPEALSKLIPMTGLSVIQFKTVIGLLFKYVEKDRQQENLVDKLCLKLLNSSDPEHHLRVCICLNKLVASERCLRRLLDNLSAWQVLVLRNKELMTLFEEIRTKLGRTWKGDSKVLLEEFESRLKGVAEERNHKLLSPIN